MGRVLLLPLLAAVLLVPAQGATGRPEIVQLKSGTRLVGRIVEDQCSDKQLVLRDIRTRAVHRIPWDRLQPEQAHRLRVLLGFEVEESGAGALEMDGLSIVNRAGNIFKGLLLNAESAKRDGEYRLKTATGVMRIRSSDVRSLTAVRISALDVFTPEELYEKRLKELDPVDSAEKHFLLAEYARTVGALDKALEHYQAAVALEDPKYSAAKLQRLIDMVTKLLGSKEALDEIKEIKKQIHYNRFKKAVELIEAFRTKHEGDEALLAAAAEQETDLKDKRTGYYTVMVPKLVRDTVKDLLARKVKQKDLTLREAMQYAGGEVGSEQSVSHEAVGAIAEKLGIEPDEVLTFWGQRNKSSLQRAFYRDGTFLVIENLQDALAKAPRAKVQRGGPKPPRPHKQMTPDEWWESKVKTHKFTDLRDWSYALWAEKSGMCELIDPKDTICPVCAGKGYLMQIFRSPRGAIPYADRCSNCHMAGFWRVVRFR